MKYALKVGPAPRDHRSCGARDAFLPAPGEFDEQEIIVRAFLFDAVEHFAKLAICQKKAQPPAFIPVTIVVQDLFDVHGNLLVDRIEHIRMCNDQYPRAGLLAIHVC
jgi:UDP-N-acetylmuramyl pentapeptide synthase